MGKEEFRWGILGPGRIARKFATSLAYSKNGKLIAVASTSGDRAASFAAEFGANHHFDSYEALADSGLVDAIYIATPHSFHRRDAAMCLQKKIPVLCEKPLSTHPEDSASLISLAKENQTFLMEGLWTCFLPSFRKALQWVQEGRIGDVLHLEADFGHKAAFDMQHRHFNPELGGGVMKDIGIYPLALFMKVLGHELQIQSTGIRLENGVDAQVIFQGKPKSGGKTFQGMVSFLAAGPSEACITGTEGRIRFAPQWFRPVDVWLEKEGCEAEYFSGKAGGFGFQFEADEVERCVRSGLLESPDWTHEDSLAAARLIAEAELF
jgi:predicted dehydrogenase